MNEQNHPYVKYLNSLHNYNAQNQNAYGEKNIESPYYMQTMVELDICKKLCSILEGNESCILVLTGHAGDGKTSLMYQVLTSLDVEPDFSEPKVEVTLLGEKVCCCIKDFSELSDVKKLETMKEIMEYPKQGKSVFMVANTGPLINTLGALFDDPAESEKAKMELIEAMDTNDDTPVQIADCLFRVINVAAIDNTAFPARYLERITDDSLWKKCHECGKKEYCHIYLNQWLIKENSTRVKDFLEKYYIWENEYGHRLTIRSMTEHIAFMMTGGKSCEDIQPSQEIHQYLFFNTFFGYVGIVKDPYARNIQAVRLVQENHFDSKRIRADEDLLIMGDYEHLFAEKAAEIVRKTEKKYRCYQHSQGWPKELRRMYFFLNISPKDIWKRDLTDIFSNQFPLYVNICSGDEKNVKPFKQLIIDALNMMYLGMLPEKKSKSIPITLSKESGIAQSVQLVIGELSTKDIDVIIKDAPSINSKKKAIFLKIKKNYTARITLPMIDYFDELRNGIIATNIDPQLSHELESLKALLLETADEEDDGLAMIALNSMDYDNLPIEIEDGRLRIG